MSTPNAKAGIFSRRLLVGGAVAAIAMSFALTALVMANNLHQFEDNQNPNGISWDQAPKGSDEDCKDQLAPGSVLWHFIQNGVTDDAITSGKMTATFATAGTFTDVVSYKKAGPVLMWNIITPTHDTLLSASTNVTSDGQFNLSHVCFGPEESVAESAEQSVEGSVSESVAESVEQSVAESEAESVAESVEQSVAESVEQSVAESEAESVAESAEQSVEGSVAESEAESVAESAEQSVEGSVAESEAESVAESAEQSVEGSVAESEAESVAESVEQSGEQSVEAGTGTPEESTPDGSLFGNGNTPLPTIAFSLILLGSLGGLAYANVKTVRNRN